MSNELKLGMIGLDTSHVTTFANLLNIPSNEYHVKGGKVTFAYPGVKSADFELNYTRIDRYTSEMREKFGAAIADSPEEVAERCDAVLLTAVDGRTHLDLFRKIAPFGKPVFIDKPFTVSMNEALQIFDLAKRFDVPIMSCSSQRYAEGLALELEHSRGGAIIGADFYGPMTLQPTQPGLFWYGIHTIEMLYRTFGKGCMQVTAVTNADYELVAGCWGDGRIGTVRGNRKGNWSYGGVVHRMEHSAFIDCSAAVKPSYSYMLEQAIRMFNTRNSLIDPEETLEIIRFIEAANVSRETGKPVRL